MNVVFAHGEDCFAGWLRAYAASHGLDPAAREALDGLVALIRADLADDPAVGWSSAEGAAIRASGRSLRLAAPEGGPAASAAFPGAMAVLAHGNQSRSSEWAGAMPVIGVPRQASAAAPTAYPGAMPVVGGPPRR